MLEMPDARRVYVFQGEALLVPQAVPDGEIFQGLAPEIPPPAPPVEYYEVPGLNGAEPVPYYALGNGVPPPAGWRAVTIRNALPRMISPEDAAAGCTGRLLRAYHIFRWRRESAFCGSCGSPNGDAPQGPARRCPACGRMEFPRISPAIIVIVTNRKGQALLAHNRRFEGNIYSLIAGFNEAGETLEATVKREVREEVGVEVEGIRYAASQPWPFPNSLMVGFAARHAGGEPVPDGKEITDARWFDRHTLPNLPGLGSVARYLITRWLEGSL